MGKYKRSIGKLSTLLVILGTPAAFDIGDRDQMLEAARAIGEALEWYRKSMHDKHHVYIIKNDPGRPQT